MRTKLKTLSNGEKKINKDKIFNKILKSSIIHFNKNKNKKEIKIKKFLFFSLTKN